MKDAGFLRWIHNRLVYEHEEHEHADFMYKLRSIIATIPEDQDTFNSLKNEPYKEEEKKQYKSENVYKWRCTICGSEFQSYHELISVTCFNCKTIMVDGSIRNVK